MLAKLGPKFRIPWLVALVLMAGFLVVRAVDGFPLETNILKLLPDTRTDPLTEQAYRQFEMATGRRVVFLAGDEAAAEKLYQGMTDSGLFSEISFRVDPERTRKIFELYRPHRHSLLSNEQRRFLTAGETEKLVQQAEKNLMSPVSIGSTAGLAQDPLFTFMEFLKSLQAEAGAFTVEGDLLVARHQDKEYILVVGELEDNAFSISAQERFDRFYREIRSQVQGVELHSAGVIHHAVAGTNSARHDISTIGIGSMAGLVLLMWVAFRSLRPLMISFVPVLFGFVAALAACVLVFGKVHLFTLVFGTSLVGVSIDYSFHFLAERLSAGEEWVPEAGLRHIFAGITLGLLTSLAAYLALAVAPFSGLRQIAVFSTVGLTGAYLTVVLWFPVWLRSPSLRYRPPTVRLARAVVKFWSSAKPKGQLLFFLLALVILAIYVAFNLKADDNIRALQSSPREVVEQEDFVKEIVGSSSRTQFFVVRGGTEDEVLRRGEELASRLDIEMEEGRIKRYRSISSVLPSWQRQQEDYLLLRQEVLDPSSAVGRYLSDMGFEEEVVSGFRESYQPLEVSPLTVKELMASPLAELYSQLWIESEDGRSLASIVVLDGVTELEEMRLLAGSLDGVAFVSRADDVSALLQIYRRLSSWLVAGAYCTIFLLMLLRYRLRNALSVMIPPVGAGLAALALSAALGLTLNLFNTLALIIVLGVGIDYAIFFAEGSGDREVVMHAVLLSAVTTILSFGLLALSGTPVISSFGFVVFVGICVSLLLAPMVGGGPSVGKPPSL